MLVQRENGQKEKARQGKGFRFPFPWTPSLKRQKRGPPPLLILPAAVRGSKPSCRIGSTAFPIRTTEGSFERGFNTVKVRKTQTHAYDTRHLRFFKSSTANYSLCNIYILGLVWYNACVSTSGQIDFHYWLAETRAASYLAEMLMHLSLAHIPRIISSHTDTRTE